ncbi:MAG: CRISPR system precrRNA processing endoribonuclease RAMP protein Cas6 [Microcoleaceae cyanobacterium]
MLIKSTWILTVSEPTILPRSYPLELVKELHRRMGLEIGVEKIPTVSFSGINGRFNGVQDFVTFLPEEFYNISLCGLNETASKAIASLQNSPYLELLGAKFIVSDRQDEITTYEQLYTTLVANDPQPIYRFNLRFITPTAFAQKHLQLPLPIPELMFRSWLNSWNYFAPVYLGADELIGYLREAIALKHHRIQTRSFQIHKGFVNGFVGEVKLQVLRRSDFLLVNVANLLVNYSQFTGTGMKTRLGMGCTLLDN